jgi:hypothetical protein
MRTRLRRATTCERAAGDTQPAFAQIGDADRAVWCSDSRLHRYKAFNVLISLRNWTSSMSFGRSTDEIRRNEDVGQRVLPAFLM